MGTGAFRDTSAALERVAALSEENDRLKTEVEELRGQLESLMDKSGAAALRRMKEERDKLAGQIEEIRVANIANVTRMKEETRRERTALANRAQSAEDERDYFRDQLQNHLEVQRQKAQLRRSMMLPDEDEELEPESNEPNEENLASNHQAYAKRVTEERDDLKRELDALKEEAKRAQGPGLLKRVLRRLI